MKVLDESYKVLNDLSMDQIKTKDFLDVLKKLEAYGKKTLVITEKIDNNLFLSSRNIKNVNLVNVKSFSTYDIMNSNYLLIDKNSVDFLNKSLMK